MIILNDHCDLYITYLYFICETVELKSLRSHFHVNFIVFQTTNSWCQSTLMSFVNNFQLKIFQNNHFKTTAFSNNKCWAKLQDDLVVTSEMRFVFYSSVFGLIWAIDKSCTLRTLCAMQWHNILEKTVINKILFIHHKSGLSYQD